MFRFFFTYRWELWLVFGIPAMAGVSSAIAFIILRPVLAWEELLIRSHIPSVISILLLAVSYPFVRRSGREILTLLWGYFIVASIFVMVLTTAFSTTGVVFLGTGNLRISRHHGNQCTSCSGGELSLPCFGSLGKHQGSALRTLTFSWCLLP